MTRRRWLRPLGPHALNRRNDLIILATCYAGVLAVLVAALTRRS